MNPQIGFMSLLAKENVLDDLSFAAENGFDWFELALDWRQNFNLKQEILKEIKEFSKRYDIKLIVHTPYYLPTSSLLPELKQAVLKNVSKAILIAKKINSDRITIHPGVREMPPSAKKMCIDSLVDNLRQIVEIGRRYDIHICLENFNKGGPQLCSELTELLSVMNSVNDLKVTFDMGHSNTTDTKPTEFFSVIKDLTMNIHVHDNDGMKDEHKCPGDGNIDFIGFLSECKKARYYGPFILETFPYRNILRAKKRLSDFWEKA